jgi:hypothetical protein
VAGLSSHKSLLLSLLLVACAGAPEDSSELQQYFEGSDHDLIGADALNYEFSRNAVRASGYARSGVLPPERESWLAVARVGENGIAPVDVTRWLEAGDIDEGGQFVPCLRTPCTPRNQKIDDGERAGANQVAGAALRLVDTPHAVIWSDAGGHALLIRGHERTIQINPKLIALIEPSAESPVARSTPRVAPAGSGGPAREPASFAPDELRNHEPPPEYAPEEDSSGCDCGDLFDFDCEDKKAASVGSASTLESAFLGVVAALWLLRRSGRGDRRSWLSTGRRLLALLLVPAALLALSGRAWAQDETAPAPPAQAAQVVVHGFAPDALIAIDGAVVGQGSFSGVVQPGAHLVQVYRPGGPSYDFPITAQAGVVTQVPPPSAPAVWAPPVPERPPPPVKRAPRWEEGPYVLAQLGFVVPTARPDGFHYELATDEDTGREREKSGIGYMVGATAGYRLVRWFGMGGLLMYGRAGGEGTVRQIERTGAGGRVEHEGPADFTAQSLRFGPHLRLMAGGNRARFLGGMSVGAVYAWIDLEHPDVFEQNGVLVQRGTFNHDYDGLNQFVGFDMGAEFNPGDHLLLGVAFDLFVDGTGNLSGGDPFDGTALGYFGMSIRLGYHDWAWR